MGVNEDNNEEGEDNERDPRLCIKVCSWIVLTLGIIIAIVGVVYIVYELKEGAKSDSA